MKDHAKTIRRIDLARVCVATLTLAGGIWLLDTQPNYQAVKLMGAGALISSGLGRLLFIFTGPLLDRWATRILDRRAGGI
jgi:hypothetical protein